MPILAADRFLSLRIKTSMWRDLKALASERDMSVSEFVRALIISVTRESHDTSADQAQTIAAQPIAKPTFTGHGRHDDFARAAVAARHAESSNTAKEWLRVRAAADLKPNYADREHARVLGVLAD